MLNVGWCREMPSPYQLLKSEIAENQEPLYWGRAPGKTVWKSEKWGGLFSSWKWVWITLNQASLWVLSHLNCLSPYLWFCHLSLSRSQGESWWLLSSECSEGLLSSNHQRADRESVLPFGKECEPTTVRELSGNHGFTKGKGLHWWLWQWC